MPVDMASVPTNELLDMLEASIVDIELCKCLIRHGTFVYKETGMQVHDRLDANMVIAGQARAEILRRTGSNLCKDTLPVAEGCSR